MSDQKPTTTEVTNADLARMIADLSVSVDTLAQSTKNEFDRVHEELNKLSNNHENRIANLEDKVRIIDTTFEKDLKIKLAR
jgi:methyl-accepting chemotaxis protein